MAKLTDQDLAVLARRTNLDVFELIDMAQNRPQEFDALVSTVLGRAA